MKPVTHVIRNPLDLQKILREAMLLRMGQAGELTVMKHLAAQLAEAAEQKILELRILGRDQVVSKRDQIAVQTGVLYYTCGGCDYPRLRPSYKYCPKCGDRIYWKQLDYRK